MDTGPAAPASIAPVTPALPSRGLQRPLALGLMVASGFAGLGYQIIWTQQSALWLGHEAAAVLAVVSAFFGGLAAGSLVLGPRIEKSRNAARWYAGCEALIGTWSAVLAFVMPSLAAWIVEFSGAQPAPAVQWAAAFLGTFVMLLPATAAMGATLPAMERVLAGSGACKSDIAALYAVNTFGAVLGVLGAAFWLVPQFGLVRTGAACALLNLLCAALALRLFDAAPVPIAAVDRRARLAPLGVLAATGLLGIGYEVLVLRVLSQVAENTVYTFAMLLAIYLVGTALGAAAYRRWLPRVGVRAGLRDELLRAQALACLLGIASLAGAPSVKAAVLAAAGPGMGSALAGEAAIGFMAFLLPTVVMGALFSHLATQARADGIAFARALGLNTLGGMAAPVVFGVLLVPALGTRGALLVVAAGYAALSIGHAAPPASLWVTLAAGAALDLGQPRLGFVDVPEGGRLVSYRDGAIAAVSIVEDAQGVARLHIDNRQQEGSSATLFADARQALLPLLLHPAPGRALFLGLGTGVTAAYAAQEEALEVDAVELLPEVIDASAYFRRRFDEHGPNPRLRLMTADARRYVRASRDQYDVIVSDNFHPARSGSGSLYTVEHFAVVRGRLAPGGLFCQWLPLHQLDLATLRSIVRSFVTVYPQGRAVLATNSLETPVIGLVARRDGEGFGPAEVRARLAQAASERRLAEFGIDDEFALLGSFIAGPGALARFAGDAPLNTDDHPVVAYRAPRITYAPDSRPRDRLIALLDQIDISPGELLAGEPNAQRDRRLAAYWSARDRFLHAGRDVQPSADVVRMLAQVREPLLAVLRTSPDFRPAYDPLLRMAIALSGSDAGAARALLTQLEQLQPARPEAGAALRALGGGAQ